MNKRTKNLLDILEEKEIDAMLIVNPSNRRYLSCFAGSSGVLYISASRQVLLTDFRYIEQATNQSADYTIVDHQAGGMLALIKEYMDEENVETLGIEGESVTYAQYKEYEQFFAGISIQATKHLVEKLRQIKDEGEIDNVKKAQAIADLAFTHILNFIKENYKKGLSENEIALELEVVMRQNGAQGTSFNPIVAAGKKSSLPHAVPDDSQLQVGDFLLMDYGCIYNGYCSDMTRTVIIGEPSPKQVEIYETVLLANKEAIKAIKAGKTGKEIDQIARNIIKDKGYGDYFGHGLGHCLGLDIHEDPRLSPTDSSLLKEGMLVTVEPGIYIPDFGGVRIEDLLVITNEESQNLTSSSKELIIIT